MDAKEAAAITDAVKGLSKDEALKRIHGAIAITAQRKLNTIRMNCDQMSKGVRSSTGRTLRSEGYNVKTSTDEKVEGRVWFEISW